jgi:hypothetical protein
VSTLIVQRQVGLAHRPWPVGSEYHRGHGSIPGGIDTFAMSIFARNICGLDGRRLQVWRMANLGHDIDVADTVHTT